MYLLEKNKKFASNTANCFGGDGTVFPEPPKSCNPTSISDSALTAPDFVHRSPSSAEPLVASSTRRACRVRYDLLLRREGSKMLAHAATWAEEEGR